MAAGLNPTNGPIPSIETRNAAAIGGTIDTAVDEIDTSDLLKGFQTRLNYTGAGGGQCDRGQRRPPDHI